MSNAFQDREKGFERKFQLDEEQNFRVQSRRDRLFGQWLAGKLGLSGAQAEAYAKEVVVSNLEKPGDEDMLAKVKNDLKASAVKISDMELSQKLRECQAETIKQVVSGTK